MPAWLLIPPHHQRQGRRTTPRSQKRTAHVVCRKSRKWVFAAIWLHVGRYRRSFARRLHRFRTRGYALPKGTKVDVHMGWASEDDYDDSIAVWGTVPAPKQPAKEKSHDETAVGFDAILERTPRDELNGEWDENVFYGEPTLRLDVQEIEVFRIRAVSYQKAKRGVSRYRRPADEELPRRAKSSINIIAI